MRVADYLLWFGRNSRLFVCFQHVECGDLHLLAAEHQKIWCLVRGRVTRWQEFHPIVKATKVCFVSGTPVGLTGSQFVPRAFSSRQTNVIRASYFILLNTFGTPALLMSSQVKMYCSKSAVVVSNGLSVVCTSFRVEWGCSRISRSIEAQLVGFKSG